MANISNTKSNSLVSGTSGDDKITNSYGSNSTLYGNSGNDTIHNYDISHWAVLDGGAGNDSIYSSHGNNVTIKGGTGNDTIRIKDLNAKNNVIQYSSGDGNDLIIEEWQPVNSPSWTLQIGNGYGTYSTQTSGSDAIVSVGEEKSLFKAEQVGVELTLTVFT